MYAPRVITNDTLTGVEHRQQCYLSNDAENFDQSTHQEERP
jgi:hypothetical protein